MEYSNKSFKYFFISETVETSKEIVSEGPVTTTKG